MGVYRDAARCLSRSCSKEQPPKQAAAGHEQPCELVRSSSAEAYTSQVLAAVSLENAALLRGTTWACLMGQCGRILGNSKGTAEDYDKSLQVDHLDYFVSHTWSTPRYKKILALMLHRNVIAFMAGSMCARRIMMLAPGWKWKWIGQVLFTARFLILLFWHKVDFKGQRLFLDKVCIHQTDAKLKRQGVTSLAAFLLKSRTLLVLYSDAYMERLWTAYELATFLLLRPEGQLEILPLDVSSMVGCYYVMVFLVTHLHAGSLLSGGILVLVVSMFTLPALAYILDRIAGVHQRILSSFVNFDIRKTKCEVESDRAVVFGNIEAFVKHTEQVLPSASQDEGLAQFNCLVRSSLPGLFEASVGHLGVPFSLALLLVTPGDHCWYAFGTTECHVRGPFQVLVISPLTVAAGMQVARRCAELRGIKRWLGMATNALVMFYVQRALGLPLCYLDLTGGDSLSLFGVGAYGCLLASAVGAVYGSLLQFTWELADRALHSD